MAETAKKHKVSDATIYAWRNHYNGVRPHSSLQYLTPAEFKLELRNKPQPAVF